MGKSTTTSTHPRPELFWDDDNDGEPEPLTQPIATIRVYKLGTNGEHDMVDTTTLDALPNRNAFRDAYGPGLWEVVGRGSSGAIAAKSTFRISMPPGQVWRPPSGASDASAPAPPGVPMSSTGVPDTVALLMQQLTNRGADPTVTLLLTHVLGLTKEMASQARTSSSEIVQAITSLAGARIQDQQGLFETMLRFKNQAGAGGGTDAVKAFKEGMDRMAALVEAGAQAESETSGETDVGALFKSFLDAFAEYQRRPSPDNVVDMAGKQRASG